MLRERLLAILFALVLSGLFSVFNDPAPSTLLAADSAASTSVDCE